MYVYIYIYIYMCMYVCMYVYIYIYIYIDRAKPPFLIRSRMRECRDSDLFEPSFWPRFEPCPWDRLPTNNNILINKC